MFSAMIKVVKSKCDKILQKQSLYSKVILIETSEEVTAASLLLKRLAWMLEEEHFYHNRWHFCIIEEQRIGLKIFSVEKMFCCIPDWVLQCNW